MTKLVPIDDPAKTGKKQAAPEDPSAPAVGRWFWYHADYGDGKKAEELVCVTHVGSNYAEVEAAGEKYHNSRRVHFDAWTEKCTPEPDAERIIAENVEKHRIKVAQLMGRVRDLTARLSVSPDTRALDDGFSTQALVLHSDKEDPKKYKQALIKAKDKTLPDLFKQIGEENEAMATWMKATLIPLQAQAEGLKPAIQAIEHRIFHVELYAGLIEEVEQIADGEPAKRDEKVRLFQRRGYMDEECLVDYEHGGMEFKNLRAFDQWFARPQHLKRLLPFPRCLMAFQVRRHDKDRSNEADLNPWVKFELETSDKKTFLYMRNGERVFRLSTGIDFGEKLFPDLERSQLEGTLYMKTDWHRVDGAISENEYLGMVEDEEREISDWERIKDTIPENEHWHREPNVLHTGGASRKYEPMTPESVYFDDGQKWIRDQIDAHNRIILVLQGLFDRSPVFAPHGQPKLWTSEGFTSAVAPIYDDSRTLVAGDKPDFEAYRTRLNASLKVGCVTVGQEDHWEREEARKFADSYHRGKTDHERYRTHYRPSGNPGPGTLARIVAMSRGGGCKYTWTRRCQGWSHYGRRQGWSHYGRRQGCRLTVPREKLLNVDAYQPGDFHLFFDDPRTRADYLQWAWMLMSAEEYHAGNEKLREGDEEDAE